MSLQESRTGESLAIPLHELADFETDHAIEMVARIEELPLPEPDAPLRLVSGEFDFHAWAGREPLKSLMQPKGFIGPLADVRLAPIENPFDQLLTSDVRGQTRMLGRKTAGRVPEDPVNEHLLRSLTVGFSLDYTIKVRGISGHPVSTEFYIVPVPFSLSRNKDGEIRSYRHMSENYGGMVVSRVVMRPQVADTAKQELAESRQGLGAAARPGSIRRGISHAPGRVHGRRSV